MLSHWRTRCWTSASPLTTLSEISHTTSVMGGPTCTRTTHGSRTRKSRQGDLKGMAAMSRGSNQKIRMQGAALGLVLSAAINHGIAVLPEQHQHIVGFNELVEQAQAATLESYTVEPEVTRTSSPAVGGSSGSSREAQPPVETRTDRSHRSELRQFR